MKAEPRSVEIDCFRVEAEPVPRRTGVAWKSWVAQRTASHATPHDCIKKMKQLATDAIFCANDQMAMVATYRRGHASSVVN
jgi:DNA-binding LacI/PurR family transcriptional regulator